MALVFFDNCDYYGTNEIMDVYDHCGNTSELSIVSGSGRNGTNCIQIDAAFGASRWLDKCFPATGTVIIGHALYHLTDVGSPFGMRLYNYQGVQVTLRVESDGSLALRRGDHTGTIVGQSDAGVIAVNTWYFIEMKVEIGNSADFSVRVGGQEVINETGKDTQNQSVATVSRYIFYNSNNEHVRYDDMYIIVPGGAYNNDFLGDVRIDTLYPTGAGFHSDFVPSTGSTNWNLVDDPSTSTSDFVTANEIDDIDTYEVGSLDPLVTDQIKAVAAVTYARKPSGGTAVYKGAVRYGGQDYTKRCADPTRGFLGASWRRSHTIWERRPWDGDPWTQDNIAACEFGQSMGDPLDVVSTTTTAAPVTTTTTTA
jgi:hypothetical protein